jgi:diguanylate cyclase (GGDEF)-like protein
VPVRLEIASLMDDPIVDGFVVTGSDITELRATRRELEYLASHDHLTGLCNRTQLVRQLERYVQGARERASLAFIDLNRFKPINDTFGHEAGDELLVQVAERLQGLVRPTDVVARVGGDEFVVLAPGLTRRPHVAAFARRLRDCFDAPFRLEVGSVSLDASIGCVTTTRESTVSSILADADQAMYVDKAARSRSVTADIRGRFNVRHRLATEIEAALKHGQIMPYLQPVVEVGTRAIVGYEALIRWEHPELGVLGAGDFLGIVDAVGLEHALGERVLDRALGAVARLRGAPWLAVNLGVTQLVEASLCDRVLAALAQHGFPAERLRIEITELAVLSERRTTGGIGCDEAVRRLHRAGARVVLDDFGTGLSSLTHLRRLPLTGVKIDRSFVRDVNAHAGDRNVVKGVIDLAHALGFEVTAEGVETEPEHDALAALGCDLAQGFLFSAAVPAGAVLAWDGRLPAAPGHGPRAATRL